jgi:hypothetical protein
VTYVTDQSRRRRRRNEGKEDGKGNLKDKRF